MDTVVPSPFHMDFAGFSTSNPQALHGKVVPSYGCI
jgi:hypothetical protein